MNLQEYMENPTKIEGLDSKNKILLYQEILNEKGKLDNTLNQYKAQQELLENNKNEVLLELKNLTGLDNIAEINNYIKDLELSFNNSMQEELVNLKNIKEKLGI